MAKYGPASSLNSLSGVDPEYDAKEVQDFLLLITEHRDYFKHRIKPNLWNEADSLCDKIHPILNEFVDETEGKKLKNSGTKMLLELNQFSSTIKKLVDTQTSKTK
jgi:thiol-disulfide isomerase/thioredoxin